MGEILDRLDKERIFEVEMTEDKKHLIFQEGCDHYTEIKERMGMVENKKNDVCRCIARVYRWGALRPHRCSNPVWKDGYCKTHHMKIPALNLLPKKENTVMQRYED